MEQDGFQWETVTLPPGVWSYGSIVSAIIATRYTQDTIAAIQANIIAVSMGLIREEKVEEYKDEFREFTDWRDHAKEVAKELLGEV